MSPVARAFVEQMRREVHNVLGPDVSKIFLGRVDAVLEDWSAGKLTAAQACEKIQKSVALFISEEKSQEIGNRCAPVVMRESVSG